MAVSRRLVAVFAADVEGYSRLMGADEVATLKGLTERRAILDRIIGDHRGRIRMPQRGCSRSKKQGLQNRIPKEVLTLFRC
jgi:class 3 adenylate cyclase